MEIQLISKNERYKGILYGSRPRENVTIVALFYIRFCQFVYFSVPYNILYYTYMYDILHMILLV